MVEIPEYFKHKAARQFGEAGPGWVQELPSLLARCIQQWDLRDCQPIKNLSINLVCYATSPQYGPVVLKIQGPHTERFTEMMALELYAGRYACQCLECDRAMIAMLLERILPGNDLRSIPDKDNQLAIGTEMLCTLPLPLDNSHGLPHYRDWLTNAFSTIRSQYAPDAQLRSLMDSAWELFLEIEGSGQFLLHGDLHHENMLHAGNGTWKIIDPQGVIGSPVFECGRFIQNHVIDNDVFDWEAVPHTVAYIAERMQQPPRSVVAAFFILHLLSMCWGYEMNYDPEQLAQGIGECVMLRQMLKEY